MILGFKIQFVPKVISGTKIHTIRKDVKNRWKTGNKIHFSTGLRTKNYKQFLTGKCVKIDFIKIKYIPSKNKKFVIVLINNLLISPKKIKIIAKNDGFNCVEDFFAWFNTDFEGKIIYWKLDTI